MKNRYSLLLFVFISVTGLLSSSCGGRPSNVLSEDKMVSLMVDMELTEAYVNTQTGYSGQDRINMGERVLKAHGVSQESLDTTLAWYGRNMDSYSQLFDKVDKEIEKRKKHYTETPGEPHKEPDNLWPFSTHVTISPLSGSDALIFSFQDEEVDKGEVLEFSYYLPNPTAMKGTLGVEYTDGYGEASVVNTTTKNKVEISLQTDSSRQVARLYGVMMVKDKKVLPLYLDSISLKAEPIDTLNYRTKRRSQKSFGPLP